MKKIGTLFGLVAILAVCALSQNCGKREPASGDKTESSKGKMQSATKPTRTLSEGKLHTSSKHACLSAVEAQVLRSKPNYEGIEEETKKAIDTALSQQPGKPVVWVRLNLSVEDFFKVLRQRNPAIESFKKEEFYGTADAVRINPVAPNGIVEVDGLSRYLKQDLIFHVNEDIRNLEVLINEVSLANFSF